MSDTTNQPTPPLPSPQELRRLEAAMAAQKEVRQAGGDPAALDALAMVRACKVEGVTLFANPPATYAALQNMKRFFPAPEGEEKQDVAEDQLVAMAYAFAEPVTAYLLTRKGAEVYLEHAFNWAGETFPGADASYRLGRVVGWCYGILNMLDDAANPQNPAATTKQPAPALVPPPDRTQVSFPQWWNGLWRSFTKRGKAPLAPSPWPQPSPFGPPASNGTEGNPPAPVRK